MDRRTLLAAALASPVVLTAPAALAASADADILAAFEIYRHAPENGGADWKRVQAAEAVILETPAKTLAGLEVKLRVVIDCLCSEPWFSAEARRPVGSGLTEISEIDDYSDRLLFRLAQNVERLAA